MWKEYTLTVGHLVGYRVRQEIENHELRGWRVLQVGWDHPGRTQAGTTIPTSIPPFLPIRTLFPPWWVTNKTPSTVTIRRVYQ